MNKTAISSHLPRSPELWDLSSSFYGFFLGMVSSAQHGSPHFTPLPPPPGLENVTKPLCAES